MASRTELIFAVVLAILGLATAKSVPNYVHICKSSDPEYSECLLKTIDSIKQKMAKGIPKLRIPAMEPLVISALEFNPNLEGARGNLRVTDLNVHGGSKFVINSLNVDPKTMTAKISLTLPQLSGHGRYDTDGRLAGFGIKSKGYAKANFTNIQADVHGSAKVKNTNGIRHFIIDKVSSNIRFLGDAKLKLTSDKPHDSALVNAFNIFFQENRKDIFDVMTPLINETTADIIRQVFDSLFSTLPLEEIFPA